MRARLQGKGGAEKKGLCPGFLSYEGQGAFGWHRPVRHFTGVGQARVAGLFREDRAFHANAGAKITVQAGINQSFLAFNSA